MTHLATTFSMTLLFAALLCSRAIAQNTPPVILLVDVEDLVSYRGDVGDFARLATEPNITTPLPPRNFSEARLIGDIVAVNGQPAKGSFITVVSGFDLSTNPNPGQALADTVRHGTVEQNFEILKPDGTLIGSIMLAGTSAGPPPPGAPLAVRTANNAIVGGTGAFLAVRGQSGQVSQTLPVRNASAAEDPANRRRHGGGSLRFALHVIPMFRPEIVATSAGPAVTHSADFSVVSPSRPAVQGEILSAFATGLGPVVPGVDPGAPFPSSPPATVNSPVEVLVNGIAAEVLAAVGYPGAVDAYQVNFRLPPNIPRGVATVSVAAGWIRGNAVQIPVQ